MQVVVCDIGGIWLCQLFTTQRERRVCIASCLWYRGDMTLSAIHNPIPHAPLHGMVVCDIGGIWLCQLFTTVPVFFGLVGGCLWYRGDMTLSAIHNWPSAWLSWAEVVCDIGGIWLCQLFTTSFLASSSNSCCLWYRGDMTLSAIHNARKYFPWYFVLFVI